MNSPETRVTIDTAIQFRDQLPKKVDVVIIGGGVLGIFSALYLVRMGKSVIVLEKGRVAGEQSSRNWGWIRQQGRDAAELPIMMHAMKLWQEVNRETNEKCGIIQAPINYLARDEKSAGRYEAWIELAREHGLESRILSPNDIGHIFNGQSPEKWVMGVTTPSDARGEPWVAVPTVARLASEQGALIRENCAVRALDIANGEVKGVVTEDGTVECEEAVLCGGAWSSIFAQRHGIKLPQLTVASTVVKTTSMPEFTSQTSLDDELAIRRRVDGGYTLALTDKNGVCLGPDTFRNLTKYLPAIKQRFRQIDFKSHAPSAFPDSWTTKRYWTEDEISPFEKNRVLEPKPDEKYVKRIVARFAHKFPKIGPPTISTSWAGMVDTMPDFVPVVDRPAQLSGLLIATGMSGHGFGIGPGFGRIIARMIAGHEPEHDLSRFKLSRFTDGRPLNLGPGL